MRPDKWQEFSDALARDILADLGGWLSESDPRSFADLYDLCDANEYITDALAFAGIKFATDDETIEGINEGIRRAEIIVWGVK